VYNLISEQINAFIPYSDAASAWLGAATSLTGEIIEVRTMSDGSVIESVKNTLTTGVAASYDIGVHSSTITIRAKHDYRHALWKSLEYHVDYDFNSSYGVISWKPPHVITYSAGADEAISVNAYNISGSKVRCQSFLSPSSLGIIAVVDGLNIQVESMSESHTETAISNSFTGTLV